jgi:hypothetical protein
MEVNQQSTFREIQMISFKQSAGLTAASLALGLAACGGGSSGGSPSAPIAVSMSVPPPATMSIGATAAMTATVSNDPASAGVQWAVSCSAADCGSFNPAQTSSGLAATYTPPSTLPSPATVTVKATSMSDASKSASGTIQLTAAAARVLADGTYVFHLSGIDGNGPYFLAGAFKVVDGAITAGEQDYSDAILGSNDALVADQSSLKATGGNIQIILATANTAIGINGIETIRGTLVSPTRFVISEFDPYATATGSIDLQTSAAAPSGGYAFAVQGTDTNNGNALVLGGILTFNGTALTAGNSVFDWNDGGAVLQNQAFASGSMTAPDAFGRVTMDLVPAAGSQVPEVKFSAYIVGSDRLQLIEDQSDALNANLGGTALGQGTHAGTFSLAGVAGSSYAHGSAGVDASNGALTLAGGFGLNADGSVGGRMAFVDAANHQGNDISGTYTVDPSGRVTLNQIALATTGVTLTFQLYLDGNGNGLVMGMDQFQVTEGMAYLQVSGTPLSGSYALSAQGASNGGTWSAVGPVTVTAGSFSGTTDFNYNGIPQPTVALTGSQNTASGELHLTGLSGDTTTGSGWGYYPIDAARTLAIEIDGQQFGLLLLERQSP